MPTLSFSVTFANDARGEVEVYGNASKLPVLSPRSPKSPNSKKTQNFSVSSFIDPALKNFYRPALSTVINYTIHLPRVLITPAVYPAEANANLKSFSVSSVCHAPCGALAVLNGLSILPSIPCQLHHFWQAHSCPVGDVNHPLSSLPSFVFFADASQPCNPALISFCMDGWCAIWTKYCSFCDCIFPSNNLFWLTRCRTSSFVTWST